MLACAVLAGCKGVRECAEFAESLSQTHLEALRAWRNPKTRRYKAPSYVTLWRTASRVDCELFEQTVNQWFRDEQRLPEAVALDGKTLRATLQNQDGGVCAVSAVSHDNSPLFSTRSSLTRKARRLPPSKS